MTFGELKVGDRFHVVNTVAGKVTGNTLYTKTVTREAYNRPSNCIYEYPRSAWRSPATAYCHLPDDARVELA